MRENIRNEEVENIINEAEERLHKSDAWGSSHPAWVIVCFVLPYIKKMFLRIIELEKKLEERTAVDHKLDSCVFRNNNPVGYVITVQELLLKGKMISCETRMGVRLTLQGRTPEQLSIMGVSVEDYQEFIKKTLMD